MPGKWTRNLIAINFRIFLVQWRGYIMFQINSMTYLERALIVLLGTVFSNCAVDGTELCFVTLIRRSYGCCLNYVLEELTIQVKLWLLSPLYNRFSQFRILAMSLEEKKRSHNGFVFLGPKLLIVYQILLKLLIEIIKHFS